MRFDHDFNLFWKLTSVLILYANITWRKSLIYVLLFPIFQRSCGVLRHPVFWTECKGKGLFYFNQFFSGFYEDFFLRAPPEKPWRTKLFWKADGKDKWLKVHHQFFPTHLFTSPSHSSRPKELPAIFSKAGRKDKQRKLTSKSFFNPEPTLLSY